MGLLKHPPTSLRASYLTLGKVSCGAPPIDSMKLSKWDYVTDLRTFMDNLLIRNYIPSQIFGYCILSFAIHLMANIHSHTFNR